MIRGALAAAAAACALAAAARPARACEPGFAPSSLDYPKFDPADATVVSDAYTVACEATSCTVTATLGVDVPSVTRVTLAGSRAHDATFSADGAAPTREITLQPGTKQLVVTAKVDLSPNVDSCFQTGISARHPVLGGALQQEPQYALRTDSRSDPTVTAPAGWDVATNHGLDGERPVATTWLTPPPPAYYPGGPFALVGVASGAGDTVRLRAGWELAAVRSWLVLGGAFDTDFGSLATVAVTADATTRAWVLPLSYSGGIGPVVVVSPSAHFGGRAHVSVALGPARVVASLDVLTSGDASVGLWLGGSL